MIALLLLMVASDFAGPQACEPCHKEIYNFQRVSHHAGALRRVEESALGTLLRPLKERGGAAFRYEQTTSRSVTALVDRGGETAQLPLEWTFGAGAQAYTPVGRRGDAWVEHRVSWYRMRNGLGLTPGHDPTPSSSAELALGIVQSPEVIYRCFNCHATNVRPDASGGPELSSMIQGVTCERCHGPGRAHIEAAVSGKTVRGTVFNSGRLPARQQTSVCAECHRSPDAQYRSPTPEIENPLSVRFAPVGLMASRCFEVSGRLSCLTCHNPHQNPRPSSDPVYAQVCLGCHPHTKAHRNTASAGNCIECHMKSTEAAANLRFTDHRIRVYLD